MRQRVLVLFFAVTAAFFLLFALWMLRDLQEVRQERERLHTRLQDAQEKIAQQITNLSARMRSSETQREEDAESGRGREETLLARLDGLEKKVAGADQQHATMAATLAALHRTLEEYKTKLEAAAETRTAAETATLGTLAALGEEGKALAAKLEVVASNLAGMGGGLGELHTVLAELRTGVGELRQASSADQKAIEELRLAGLATAAAIATLEKEQKSTRNELTTAWARLDEAVRTALEARQRAARTSGGPPPLPPPEPPVTARVKATEPDGGIVVIEAGADQGLDEGHILYLFRERLPIARARVLTVYPALAGAEVVEVYPGQIILPGDLASTLNRPPGGLRDAATPDSSESAEKEDGRVNNEDEESSMGPPPARPAG